MPDPATLKAIADAGGWAAFAVGAFLIIRAFARGDLVPGSYLTRALAANDKQATAMSDLTGSVKELASQTGSALTELRKDVDELRRGRSRGA